MVLETLDIKKEDIFIYSENRFDLQNNFRLIYKDLSSKNPIKIHFNDVCKYLGDNNPKSLIVYRLLSNLPEFDSATIKYGYNLLIEGVSEVIFFDPIYALRELEEFEGIKSFTQLRFRIQQIGLISKIRIFDKINFSEVYSFDLEPTEARWQNDRAFAELIFAFQNIAFDEPIDQNKYEPIKNVKLKRPEVFKTITAADLKEITLEEDFSFDPINMKKLISTKKASGQSQNFSESILPNLSNRKISDIDSEKDREVNSFIKKIKSDVKKIDAEDNQQSKKPLVDLFKSSAPIKEYLDQREKKQVVLKIK